MSLHVRKREKMDIARELAITNPELLVPAKGINTKRTLLFWAAENKGFGKALQANPQLYSTMLELTSPQVIQICFVKITCRNAMNRFRHPWNKGKVTSMDPRAARMRRLRKKWRGEL